MTRKTLLSSIGSTEESSFSEICRGLGDDCPASGTDWREMFDALNKAERDGLIDVSRTNGRIDSAILTEAGVAEVRK